MPTPNTPTARPARRRIFFSEFLKHRRDVGSIIPSSPFLARKMCKGIDFDQAKVIVELGPGDGCITKPLLARMRPDAKLITFEINESFVELLQATIDDPRLVVLNVSAEQMVAEVERLTGGQADYVVSGLPFINFPQELRTALWKQIHDVLKPGGKYIQYSYATTLKKQYQKHFSQVRVGYTLLNIPPAFVFTCKK